MFPLVLASPIHAELAQSCSAYSGNTPPPDEAERLQKLESATRINPWSLFDQAADYEGQYVDTVGFLSKFGSEEKLYLVPSKEYGDFFLPHYALTLSAACLASVGVRAGDHVRLVGKIAVDEGWSHSGPVFMVEILHVRSLRWPPSDAATDR